jgi:hypothetical protein
MHRSRESTQNPGVDIKRTSAPLAFVAMPGNCGSKFNQSQNISNMETFWRSQKNNVFNETVTQIDTITGKPVSVQSGWKPGANVTFNVQYKELVSGLVNQRCDYINEQNGVQGIVGASTVQSFFTNSNETTRLTYADCGTGSQTHQFFKEARKITELWKVKQEAVQMALVAEKATIDSSLANCKRQLLTAQANNKNLRNSFVTELNFIR